MPHQDLLGVHGVSSPAFTRIAVNDCGNPTGDHIRDPERFEGPNEEAD